MRNATKALLAGLLVASVATCGRTPLHSCDLIGCPLGEVCIVQNGTPVCAGANLPDSGLDAGSDGGPDAGDAGLDGGDAGPDAGDAGNPDGGDAGPDGGCTPVTGSCKSSGS